MKSETVIEVCYRLLQIPHFSRLLNRAIPSRSAPSRV
jgi:hypothetical protein